MNYKKALVTGANGFIGKNLTMQLANDGYMVYALVRNIHNVSEELKKCDNIQIIECPMNKYKDLSALLANEHIDITFHLAWEGTSGPNRANYEIQNNNVLYSCDLLQNLNIKRFVFAGSLMEFEFLNAVKLNLKISSNSIYNTAKLSARNMLHILANNKDIDFLPLTISNVFGVGENSERFLINLIKKIKNNEHIPLTHGEQLYDFIYITDAVHAIKLVGEKGLKNKNYYIGNTHQRKLKDYITTVKNILSTSLATLGFDEIKYLGALNNYSNLDTCSLKNDFLFEPKVSFSEGVKKIIKSLEGN